METNTLDQPKACLSVGHPPASGVLEKLRILIEDGGPHLEQYHSTAQLFREAEDSGVTSDQIAEVFGSTLVSDCIHGFGYLKPHGYAGDFEMIDRIYTNWESPLPHLKNWDRFFHAQPAPKAVRNRKDLFKRMLSELPGNARVLNIGSGPCRDLMEFFDDHPEQKIDIVNMELDPAAIRYATRLCNRHLNKVKFIEANLFRYNSDEQFDLIWSAGLFDYFSDKMFRVAMKRIRRWLRPGGRVIVGNFNTDNDSKAYMELLGQWNLKHRSKTELISLAEDCGFEREQLSVFAEPLNVNLFLEGVRA